MKITGISAQSKNQNRVNVSVDGKYRFSLDIYQVADLGIRVGKEYTEAELSGLETESQFGRLYARALEYVMLRPHSGREVKDYLYRKTLTRKKLKREVQKGNPSTPKSKIKNPKSDVVEIPGYSPALAQRVYDRLVEKSYIDDEKFARFWVENRNVRKGSSLRKLTAELRAKGVAGEIIDQVLGETERTDGDELAKIIAKKRNKYPDDQRLMAYLARQGFGYDDIKSALQD